MIGTRTSMLDAAERVTGRLAYTINATLPGTLHVAIRRSDVPHGRVARLDVSQALAMDGVVTVLTADDFPDGGPMRPTFGPIYRDQPIVAVDRVRYVGDPVAAVAAVDKHTAERAVATIDVEFEELPSVTSVEAALEDGAPLLHDEDGEMAGGYADIILRGRTGNICNEFVLHKGSTDEGFAQSDEIFEHTFRSPAVQHVALEPHACIAFFEGQRLTVQTSTQTPYAVRDALAHMFDLPVSQVRVIVPPLGGGFGGKTYPKVEPLAAALAFKTGRPVKVVLSRDEEFITNSKHQAIITLKTGVKRDGTLVAKKVSARFNAGAYTDISPRLIKNGGYACAGPYRIPHIDVESLAIYTNLPPAGAFRGYGVSQAAWAHESQMDMIAAELDIDPVELRMRNLLEEGEAFATGEPIHGARFKQILGDALQLFADDPPAGDPPGAHIRTGRGCSVIIKSTITPSSSSSVVKLNADGSLQVLTSTVEMGQGAHTALAQVASQQLGIPVASIRVVAPDTDVTPYDTTTSSSRSTAAMGNAVGQAVGDVSRQLLDLAADQLEVDPADLLLQDGAVSVKGSPRTAIPIGEILTTSQRGTLVGKGTFLSEGGLNPETGQGVASDHWHQGALAAEVEVDTRTGKVRVKRLRATVYAGTVVNPVNARMQVEGSVIFGLSQALFEQIENDGRQVTNPNLSDYAIAGRGELPGVFEPSLLEDPDDDQVHGLGETALPVVMPAIANAVADAIGVRLTELPLTAERVLTALEDRDV